MNEYAQAAAFYNSLNTSEKKDLADSIAADIFFLDDALQEKVLLLLNEINCDLSKAVEQINNFTT